ncbi:hypothetical protein GCM10007973_07640 [Polymorphobacter multimanifer]|nr:hypothetical protein GCM10007973_07640 [Polymorphobacter multimanifer]
MSIKEASEVKALGWKADLPFERVFGGNAQLELGGGVGLVGNYLWNGARAFCEEGGKWLHARPRVQPAVA